MAQLTLEEAAAIIGGLKKIKSKGQDMYVGPCPLCKAGTDRFYMNENADGKPMWGCRSGHMKTRPDFFFVDALLDMLGIRTLDGSERVNYTPRPRPAMEPPKFEELINEPVQLTLSDAIRFNKNSSAAMIYFGQYGINQKSIDRFKLGYATNPPHCALPAGWTIPNISWGPDGLQSLRSMQIRRDEEACRNEWAKRAPGWVEAQRYKLLQKWALEIKEGRRDPAFLDREPTDDELMDFLGWPKYSSIKGSHSGIWGDDLISLPDGSRPGPRLPYIFLVEDAKSAIVLRQDGYPAVAYRRRNDWSAYLPTVFENAGSVYILYDNDDGAGIKYAREFEGHILAGQKSAVRLFTTPPGLKQVSDLTKAEGFDAMRDWISSKIPGLTAVMDSDNDA